MNVGDRRRVPATAAMTGPLAPYELAVRTEMVQAGYAPSSAVEAAAAMRRLSSWMNEQGVAASGLTAPMVAEFVAARRRYSRNPQVPHRWLGAVARLPASAKGSAGRYKPPDHLLA